MTRLDSSPYIKTKTVLPLKLRTCVPFSEFSPKKGIFCPKWGIFEVFAQKGAFSLKIGYFRDFHPKRTIFDQNGVFSNFLPKIGYFRDFRPKGAFCTIWGAFEILAQKGGFKKFRKNWKKIICGNFLILQDFWKLFFRKWNHRKLINGSWDVIISMPTSNAYNTGVFYSNIRFYTFKWQYSSRCLTWNSKLWNLMSDLGDIAISRNCQSYPNWHESIFEDLIFWEKTFKNQFLQKNPEDFTKHFFGKKFKKIFFKKNLIFFEKLHVLKKLSYFARFLKIVFQKMKSSKIDQWQLGFDLFCQLQRPITRMSIAQMKILYVQML